MKKKNLYISVFAAFIIFAVSCSGGSNNTKNATEVQNTSTEVYYTCSMHPEVHEDKQGDCPKCGMELVKKEDVKVDSTQIHNHTDSMKTN